MYVIPSFPLEPLEPPQSSLAAPTSSAYANAAGETSGGLPLATRLIMRVEFDTPHASSFPVPEQPGPGEDPLQPEPWAVVLKLKIVRSANDAQPDAVVPNALRLSSWSVVEVNITRR